MKHKVLWPVFLSLAFIIAFGGVMLNQSSPTLAQESGPTLPQSPQTAVGNAFTYQGYLEDSSGAVHSSCDFQLSLWNSSSGGTQVGSTQTKTSVSVNSGYFSVPADFGTSAFDGNARYMQIAVRCPSGSGSYTTLSGRVELTAAPYAHSLRPGASVTGDTVNGSVFKAISTSTGGSPAALYGEAVSSNGTGVSGWNTGSSGGYAVYGRNTAGSGTPYGVYGYASHSSATSYGMFGKSDSSAGTGVGGQAPMNGVYGEATASSGSTWGVYGKAGSSGGYGVYGYASAANGYTYGVYGKADSSSGKGVYGEGGYFGVHGYGTDPTGVSYGVYGHTDSDYSGSYGGYFRNDNNVGLYAQGHDTLRSEGDIRLAGDNGTLTADEYASSNMGLISNDNIYVYIDNNDDDAVSCFSIFDPDDSPIIAMWEVCHSGTMASSLQATTIRTADDEFHQLYGVSSTQVWVEDFGSGKLENGAAVITIEPIFAQTVDLNDYHIFLTPLGNCNGLYVTAKTATSFEVHELGDGVSNVEFDYRIVAQQIGYEDFRLEQPHSIDQ